MTEINLKEGCEYSKDKLLELRRKFPAHFNELSCVCPHEESYPQHVIAYRLCIHNEQLDTEDFTPTYRETTRQLDMGDPSTYSVSLFTDINDINFIGSGVITTLYPLRKLPDLFSLPVLQKHRRHLIKFQADC